VKDFYTKREQIELCILALMHWSKVRPVDVYLESWKCGTQACFGGHLATWDTFKALGVSNFVGEPVVGTGEQTIWASQIAALLFGDSCLPRLFSARSDEDWLRDFDDHQIIVNRLEKCIEELS
jgi:hypothetical protein